MKKRKPIALIAVFLIVSVLLNACSFSRITDTQEKTPEGTFFTPKTEATQTEPEETTEPETHTPYTEYERPREPVLAECSFDEITYERPDAQAILDDFAELQELVEAGASWQEILQVYEPIDEATTIFSTMNSYAHIRYTLDLNDSYYDDEYNWCEEQMPILAQAEEKCFIAMAKSAEREKLEEEFFGEDFFDFYDENQIFSNDRVVELMQKESALESEYMALQSDKTIEWKGEEQLVDDLLADDSLGYMDYLAVIDAYYSKYNPLCADILIELILVRNEIAQELGYETYADFAYSYYYERDYSPEQVRQYLDSIAENLQPLYFAASASGDSTPMDTDTTMALLEGVAYELGGEIATAYDYMMAYDLYDITESTSKMPGSYMTYLYAYEMPYMYVSPTNEIGDLMTAAHEFGHFVDGYVNCNGTSSIDCNEIFSQALEYLTIDVADLSRSERESLRKSQAASAVTTFLGQACYADFEMQLYLLDEDELTAENFNRIFGECMEKYLYEIDGYEKYYEPGWFEVQHFFISSHYVISYCVSLDAALQVYQCELEDGSGLETYRRLLSLSSGTSIQELMQSAELASPFDEGRMEALYRFLRGELYS